MGGAKYRDWFSFDAALGMHTAMLWSVKQHPPCNCLWLKPLIKGGMIGHGICGCVGSPDPCKEFSMAHTH